MFRRLSASFILTAIAVLWCIAPFPAHSGSAGRYQALEYPAAPDFGTWAVLDRDGAGRTVDRYLSSLGGGESGTGLIASPDFVVAVDTIAFTICGHDGQGGGRNQNLIALADAATGEVLRKTAAPGSDPMKEQSWDVAGLRGHKVRIEVRDANPDGAFAWIGIGRIDAGPPLSVDFRKGMPPGWKVLPRPVDERVEIVEGGIPFRRRRAVYTMVPASGAIEIPCGFRAERLFFLGCTVASGRPLDVCGHIEIHYRRGKLERVPLMIGYTLDGEGKLPSTSRALHIRPSGDPFQFYLVVAPRAEAIEKIRLARNPEHPWLPRVTAITCKTSAVSEHLAPLAAGELSPKESVWIQSHTITADSPNLDRIEAQIRGDHRM